MRFSIDINSSVPGSVWDGFVGIKVVRDERELVAVSEIKDCLLKSGEAVEKDDVVDCRMMIREGGVLLEDSRGGPWWG